MRWRINFKILSIKWKACQWAITRCVYKTSLDGGGCIAFGAYAQKNSEFAMIVIIIPEGCGGWEVKFKHKTLQRITLWT